MKTYRTCSSSPPPAGQTPAAQTGVSDKGFCLARLFEFPTRRLSACPNITLRHDRDYAQARGPKLKIIINCRISLFPPLPPASLVGLPIGDLEPPRLAIGPGAPGGPERIAVVAVKNQNHPVIGVAVCRQRGVVDQEPDIGPVRIGLFHH